MQFIRRINCWRFCLSGFRLRLLSVDAGDGRLIGTETLAAMKDGAIICNLARGEIVDETALKASLKAGKLRGVGLDVYVGEFERLPDAELWADDRVLFTHISAATVFTSKGKSISSVATSKPILPAVR